MLSGLSDLNAANITVDTMGGTGAACEDFSTVNTSIAIDLEYGNYPLQVFNIFTASFLVAYWHVGTVLGGLSQQ